MKLLTIPGARFHQVAYLDGQTILTAGAKSDTPLWIWEPGQSAAARKITGPRAAGAWGLFTPGAAGFLRRQGLWPDTEELPPPSRGHHEASLALLPESLASAFPVAFAPDAATALYAEVSFEEEDWTVQFHLRDPSGLLHRMLRITLCEPLCAAFPPGGRLVAVTGGIKSVAVRDVPAFTYLTFLRLVGKVEGFAFTAHGHLVAAAGRTVWIWEPGRERARPLTVERTRVTAIAVSADGGLLAAGRRDGVIRVWDVSTWAERGHHDWGIGEVSRLAFSPDGSTAAAAGRKGVVVWDID